MIFFTQFLVIIDIKMMMCRKMLWIGIGMPSFTYQEPRTWKYQWGWSFEAVATWFISWFSKHSSFVVAEISQSVEGRNSKRTGKQYPILNLCIKFNDICFCLLLHERKYQDLSVNMLANDSIPSFFLFLILRSVFLQTSA